MKIECVVEKLQNTIERIQSIPIKNASLPLIQNIYLEAKGTTLTVRVTNLEVTVEILLPVKIESEGSVLVSNELFSKLVSSLPIHEKKVTLEVLEGMLYVYVGKNKTTLRIYPLEDFPTLPNILENSLSCTLKTSQFLEGIKSVYYSASVSDMKPEIASVYVYTTESEIVFVATDSFRLAEKKIKTKITTPFNIIIPIRNINDILKLLSNEKDDIVLHFNKNTIYLATENIHISSRIIDGSFPNYHLIIPKESTTTISLLKQDITNTLKGLMLFSDKFNQVKLFANPDEKSCIFKTQNQTIGEAEYVIDANIRGEALELNFNYKYLQDSLGTLYKESIVFECTTSNKPIVVKSVADQTFLYLIMPLR